MIKRLQVVFKGMEPSPALEADIAQKIERLERVTPHVRSCRVVVDAPHRHSAQGRLFRVLVNVALPGREVVVESNDDPAHENPYIAVRDVFAAVRRRLRDVVTQDREHVRVA